MTAGSRASTLGRFGWKAQHASLLGFAGDAYLNEMGVTNRFFPNENAPNGDQALLARFVTTTGMEDPPDPVTGRSDIDASADFMRLLAPPPLRQSASALAGQKLFARINCDACHRPVMISGDHAIDALAHKAVALYSDLLLHDMGSLGDGVEQGDARQREMKTAPLWGLRAQPIPPRRSRRECGRGDPGPRRRGDGGASALRPARRQRATATARFPGDHLAHRPKKTGALPFIGTHWRLSHILLHWAEAPRERAQETAMRAHREERIYQESRIEDEPILGAVLVLPGGRIQPLTLWERVLARLHLTSAKALEARYFKAANS